MSFNLLNFVHCYASYERYTHRRFHTQWDNFCKLLPKTMTMQEFGEKSETTSAKIFLFYVECLIYVYLSLISDYA